MRLLLIICSILYSLCAVAQDLKKLEDDIQNTSIYDYKKMRQKADKIYQLDPYNERATYYLSTSFTYAKLPDSLSKLFATLKSLDLSNSKPYILSAKYQHRKLSLTDTLQVTDLLTAIKLDSNNFESYYLLGRAYYSLFHAQPNNYYAHQTKVYLEGAFRKKASAINYLKYPLMHIMSYLGDSITLLHYERIENRVKVDSNNIPIEEISYFPFVFLMDLDSGWLSNYKINVIEEAGHALFVMEWYSSNLFAMKEPLIYNQKDKTIFRFTWLRSFHNPVAIRLEKTGEVYTLFWKMADRVEGTYEPNNLVIDNSKQLTNEQSTVFNRLLTEADFWNLPTKEKQMGTDGARWIIEGIDYGKYHLVDRWSPRDDKFEELGKYLIQLTDLKIREGKIY